MMGSYGLAQVVWGSGDGRALYCHQARAALSASSGRTSIWVFACVGASIAWVAARRSGFR